MSSAEIKGYLDFYKTDFGREILKQEADYVRAWLGGCERVLDVGCGPGVFERELKELNITGVDSSPEMLEAARGLADGRFVLASAEELPFLDSSFDGLFFITSLEFTSDYRKALAEAARVLSEEGRLLILLFNKKSAYFKGMMARGGYVKKNISYPGLSPEKIRKELSEGFNVTGEYLLGIEGKRVFPSSDAKDCALYAIKGVKK